MTWDFREHLGETPTQQMKEYCDGRDISMLEMKLESKGQSNRKGFRKHGPSVVLYGILVHKVCMEDRRVSIASNCVKVRSDVDENLYVEDTQEQYKEDQMDVLRV